MRGRLRATQTASSPPCGAPGMLLVSGRAAARRIDDVGWLGFRLGAAVLGSSKLGSFGEKDDAMQGGTLYRPGWRCPRSAGQAWRAWSGEVGLELGSGSPGRHWAAAGPAAARRRRG
jgi:hypothetical protein